MVVLHFLSLKISFSRVWRANCPHVEGRIAHNGWANCNSPLHVRYPNVGKYYMQIASRAWHRFFCMRRRGELKFAHIANSPTPQFAHIAKFTHVEGRIALRPYTCIFWMLANIHVIKYKYTCKYLNTCKLMIERIYIPT